MIIYDPWDSNHWAALLGQDGILKVAEEEAAKGLKCLIIDPYNFIDRTKVGAMRGAPRCWPMV